MVSGLLSSEMSTRTVELPDVSVGLKVGVSVSDTGSAVGDTVGLKVVPGPEVGSLEGEDEDVGTLEREGTEVGEVEVDGADESVGCKTVGD